jgi:hypothetical protein
LHGNHRGRLLQRLRHGTGHPGARSRFGPRWHWPGTGGIPERLSSEYSESAQQRIGARQQPAIRGDERHHRVRVKREPPLGFGTNA